MQATGHTGVTGSALLRLLHRLAGAGAGADVGASNQQQDFAQQLSDWLGWTHAIGLSAALDGRPDGVPARALAPGRTLQEPTGLDAAEGARLRAAITAGIAEDIRLPAPAPGVAPDPAADLLMFRQRYLARQYAMAQSIERLRERLRDRLARRSDDLARLAAVDVVMQQVLGAQEQRLLAGWPGLLARYFERQRRAAEKAGDGAGTAAWLAQFSQDMQALLLAELDIRFRPVDGLIAALEARS